MKKIATTTLSLFFAFAGNTQQITKKTVATETDKTKDSRKAPEYPGGLKAFYKFIEPKVQRVISYKPGSMVVTFMVNDDGSLSNIETIEGINPKFDEKVREIIAKSPNWIPGEQDGEKVGIKYSLPLQFS